MLDKRNFFNNRITGFPDGIVLKNLPANTGDAGDIGSVPGPGRFPGAENGNPLQYSCLESPMDRGAWNATVHRAADSQTQLTEHTTGKVNGHRRR